jgi:hypothetical protein
MLQALVATLALVTTLNANAESAKGSVSEGPFKILKFDELMKDQIIRSIPLRVSIPKEYERLPLAPAVNGVVWARPDEFEAIRQTNDLPAKTGYFFGRLTLNVGYDAGTGSFICGPNCDEKALMRQVKDAADDAQFERRTVNGMPILLIEIDAVSKLKTAGGATKMYMAYIATLIDTNVALITYLPPSQSPDQGRAAWTAFRQALVESN